MLSDTSRHGRLQDIQALTDAALARLSYDDFLTELLERTRDVLRADTAAVLLLDRGQLVATAAIGLEEEVLQGVRMPLGRGFAGRIAAERRAVIVDDLDDRTMKESLLLQGSGIRSLVGVPLIAAGQLLGVLHVGSLAARTFGPEDVELLQLAAERAALAVQAKLSREDRIAATALQRSLLPSALPQVAGIDIAARHVAGQGVVGGDWYDVFQLPTGELGVVIGDVAGSGLEAAVIMGRVRSALRSYALDTRDPAEVLARLDRKMQHFEPDSIATVMYGVFDAAFDLITVSSAGHPPPAIASPGQPAELAAVEPDLLIGVTTDTCRHSTEVKVTPGSVLCFYTDGLVERPGRPLDEGLSRLCGALTADDPHDACAAVMRAMVGRDPVRDDIALLMVRRDL